MDKVFFIRVMDAEGGIWTVPVSKIEWVMNRGEKDDFVKLQGSDMAFTCYDELGTGKLANAIIGYEGR